MAKLATCPGCTTQLALPEEATLSDRARCPRCHEEFLLMETVQFSIPTAEILTPGELDTFGPSETASSASYSPVSSSSATLAAEDELIDQVSTPEYGANTETGDLASEPLPQPSIATLSDWEARLKRAIAGDLGRDEPSVRQTEPVTDEPRDFDVPEEDLQPDPIQELSPKQNHWNPETFYREEELTTTSAGDLTVVDDIESAYPHIADEHQIPVAVRIDSSTRVRGRRSPLRTLIYASLGGVVGIPLGLYTLLWLRGPAGDMLHIAKHLPSFMLPAEFSPAEHNFEEQIVQQTESPSNIEVEEQPTVTHENPADFEPIATSEPLVREDSEVAQASAALPVYQGPTFALVDPAEFKSLLTSAQQDVSDLALGDLKSKESVASKGRAYMSLARLADKMSFLSQSLTPGDAVNAKAAEELMQTAVSDPITRRDLPQIALRWWQYADRPSAGIVLVGEVKRLQTTDAGTIAYLSFGDDTVTPDIPVLMWRTDCQPGDFVGVAGSIESDLKERVPSHNGSLSTAVIAHYLFPLDKTSPE